MPLPIRALSVAARPQLERLGLKKRAADVYTIELADEWLGVVALGRATKYSELHVWLTIGVRHQPTERILATLLREPYHPYLPWTVGCGLGYLMPSQRWMEWAVEGPGTVQSVAADIADALSEFGLPALAPLTSLAVLAEVLRGKGPMDSPRSDYLVPLVLDELGRRAERDDVLRQTMDDLGGRSDEAAERYRRFAEQLGGT